jgi:glycosyltransferase involved in cell wall biosynthesis
MKNLLIITQKVDAEDDLLGFFVDWIREFSKKFDKVFVITLARGNYGLPSNVHIYSLGKERSNSKIARAFNFYRYLFRLVPKSAGIFVHMSPVFVIASWPATFIYRKKIIFWYLHRSVTMRLKIAEKLCYKIVTAAKESLNIKSKKIVETGHGINIDKFKTSRNWPTGQLKILSVGRISKIKNYDILLKAAKTLKDGGIDFNVKIIGQPVMPPDVHYFDFLKSLKEKLNLGDTVQFAGFVPHDKIAERYKDVDIVIGLTPDGGIDKAILEGMASGCLVLTSNKACRKYFDRYADKLTFDYGNSESLVEKIISLDQLPSENKKNISDFLVHSVFDSHRLQNLIDKISSLYV